MTLELVAYLEIDLSSGSVMIMFLNVFLFSGLLFGLSGG